MRALVVLVGFAAALPAQAPPPPLFVEVDGLPAKVWVQQPLELVVRIGYDAATDTVRCRYFEDSKSGTPGADTYKVKGNIHWVAVPGAVKAQVRLYDRLFTEAQPDGGGRDFLTALNPNSRQVVTAYLEPGLGAVQADERFQFERHGYFVADRIDSKPGAPVFNRAVTLKDTWQK